MDCPVCGKHYERVRYYDKAGKFKSLGPVRPTCSRKCGQELRHGDREALFWSHVDKSAGPNGCWPWTAGTIKGGYGRVGWQGQLWLAHRLAYKLTHPDFDESLDVLHHCDNPACCNPFRCLFQGNQADNMADMVAKGRSADKRGRLNGRAILTTQNVLEIVRSGASGASQRDLSAQFGVAQQTISEVLNGQRWSHVTGITRKQGAV